MNEFVEKVLNFYVDYQALNDSNRLRSKAIAAAIDRRLVMLEKNLCVTSFGAMGYALTGMPVRSIIELGESQSRSFPVRSTPLCDLRRSWAS